jgi:hypothetical protein
VVLRARDLVTGAMEDLASTICLKPDLFIAAQKAKRESMGNFGIENGRSLLKVYDRA